MKYYADTGFLLSLHLPEATSSAAAAAMRNVSEPLPLTPLVALEFRNALRLAVFRQKLTEAERLKAWKSFEKDLAAGVLEEGTIEIKAVHDEARSLCDQFTAAVGVRTLDLLHVACACALGRTEFLSFDQRQRALAQASGMNILP